MISFRGKTPPAVSAWHPDFRDTKTLPDVKVVRTSFFINGISALVLLVVALFLSFEELGRRALQEDISVIEQKIAENKARNDHVLGLNGQFQKEERYINAVVGYLDGSLELSSLLVALGETLDPGMVFSTIRYQDTTVRGQVVGKQLMINGSIQATPDAAASVITDYVDKFYQEPFLADLVKEAVPTSLVPTPEGDKMAFGIRLILQGNKKKEGEKKT